MTHTPADTDRQTGEYDDLTKEQWEILHHTLWRSAGGLYCGADADLNLKALVDGGYMKKRARPDWLPQGDAYYTLTGKGRTALSQPGEES